MILDFMRVHAFYLAALLIGEADMVRAEPTGQVSEPPVERFEIAKDGALLLLPVELKGQRLLFALDTGASTCVYDYSLIPLLGESIRTDQIQTSDGITCVQFFKPPEAKLGNLSLRTNSLVMATDLHRFREGTGENVYGVIGMDFLRKHIVRIDRDRGELLFLSSVGKDPGQRLQVKFAANVPWVVAQIAGIQKPQFFVVDTGAAPGGGTGLLQAEIFDALVQQGKTKAAGSTSGLSLSGMSIRRRGRVAEMTVGDYRHADLVFNTSTTNVLGLNYWSRYVATFDFKAGAIYLKKGSRFGQEDATDLSGLTLVRAEGRMQVFNVEDGSPAAFAGIREKDIILKANGESTEEMSLLRLRRILAVRGANVSLFVSRGHDHRNIAMTLGE
jgi:hypothetical protein